MVLAVFLVTVSAVGAMMLMLAVFLGMMACPFVFVFMGISGLYQRDRFRENLKKEYRVRYLILENY
jgi:uncharacterized membrane protein